MLKDTDERHDQTAWLLILEKLVERSVNMVVITDAEQRIRWVSRTYTQITGWDLEELQGTQAGALVRGPLTDPQITETVGHRLRQGQSISGVEMINHRKNGAPYTVSMSIEPLRDQHGKPIAYFSIQTDVSEKRALEQANARLQHHLQEAQQLARLGRIEFDADTGVVRCSSEVTSILDRPRDDNSPNTVQALLGYVAPFAQPDLRARLRQALENGDEFDQELPITTEQGARRWVRCRGIPERHGNGFRPPRTWTIQDVTLYKELIEQKQLTNQKLQAMVEERTRHLEEANRSLETFSQAISHDLKKPVRHMVSYAEIVQESLACGDISSAQAYCGKIVSAGARMKSMIDGMLEFSRMGRRGIHPARVCMAGLVEDCLSEVTASYQERRFSATGMETLPEIWVDPVLMREVWTNLIDNAFKYSRQRDLTRLDFTSVASDNGWTLSVRDNGCGFHAAMESHIFQMFGRASPDEAIIGDGIGLALCQRIVHAHGGHIRATSTPGEGSEFFLYLPSTGPISNFGHT